MRLSSPDRRAISARTRSRNAAAAVQSSPAGAIALSRSQERPASNAETRFHLAESTARHGYLSGTIGKPMRAATKEGAHSKVTQSRLAIERTFRKEHGQGAFARGLVYRGYVFHALLGIAAPHERSFDSLEEQPRDALSRKLAFGDEHIALLGREDGCKQDGVDVAPVVGCRPACGVCGRLARPVTPIRMPVSRLRSRPALSMQLGGEAAHDIEQAHFEADLRCDALLRCNLDHHA